MSRSRTVVGDVDLGLPGRLQPPLENGEIVFAEPWQGRVFGMAVRLAESGRIEWSEFQSKLIEVVAEWDARHAGNDDGVTYPYYELFAEALSRLAVARQFVDPAELRDRDRAISERAHDHDH